MTTTETTPRTEAALVRDAVRHLGERAEDLAQVVERRASIRCTPLDPNNPTPSLLTRIEDILGDLEWVPDATWWRDYFLITGDHMVLTDEGWELGCVKAEYEREYGAEELADMILDEVNAPGEKRVVTDGGDARG